MTSINQDRLAHILSQKLQTPVHITEIHKIGEGVTSEHFRVHTEEHQDFVLKRIHANDFGFELAERKIQSVLISHNMHRRFPIPPESLGVLLMNQNGDLYLLPEIGEQTVA
ncbi:hypothetical protein GF339_08020 [candidate division KSB3 bacterium]|uniref:Uncharacterized protein n=1 Tax=candidate division KSB3 bacterium TaxID=2044937 RepID=A0A9D5JV69_9BACT|nr:hypothetical protein [candidate division KSB3 bacterium]MBD3324516.1 hypothetical protein [candidate division KSB3 bacterium]